MTDVKKGAGVWLPCKIHKGPFPDERMVVIQLGETKWEGFVNTRWLKDENQLAGTSAVLAWISDVTSNSYQARVPGVAPQSTILEGPLEQLSRVETT